MRLEVATLPRLAAFAVLLAATACTDDPSGPRTPQPAAIEPRVTAIQSAPVGAPVAQAPAVTVRDESGAPIAGVEVRFEIVTGGGSLAVPIDTTDALGIASAGAWTLGDAPGLNEVVASAGSLAPVRFEATALAAVKGYGIEVRYRVPVSTRQSLALEDAVDRWQAAIRTDLPDVPVSVEAGSCFSGAPLLNETIDDLLLYVEFVNIDGVGGILGQAGPCFIRTGSGLPIVGHLKLDRADLQKMEENGTIDDVVLHEIGHVMGIGTLWGTAGLVNGAGGSDPRFIGAAATAAYHDLGALQPDVPVENDGGPGTRDSHWRESVFGSELMTGYIRSVPNPLSRLTLASLEDLGYDVDATTASSYALGGTSALRAAAAVDLEAVERIIEPIYRIDSQGNRYPNR